MTTRKFPVKSDRKSKEVLLKTYFIQKRNKAADKN